VDIEDPRDSGTTPATPAASAIIGRWRIGIGLIQGVCAWGLLHAVAPSVYTAGVAHPTQSLYWSERHPALFAALALVTAFIPTIAIAELGRMGRKMLALYLASAGAAVAALAVYDHWRDPAYFEWSSAIRVWPSFRVAFCTAVGLFIANQLLEHRARGYSIFKHYATHFEDSWMRGFQLVISFIFTLLVWGILELGASLFGLIHLEWFRTMIEHNWFRCPALAMAFAASIHLTDVRPALLRGMRNVCLTLLSWLLPLVVTLSMAFLAALTWVGLKPLWDTRHAASLLLWACAVSLLLVNAAYKDGDDSNRPAGVLRWAGRLAGPTMLVLAIIAAIAIGLRIRQHGWTPERVHSTAVTIVILIYSLGYSRATASGAPWLKPLETVNVLASLTILAILILLLTPIADPERLSVNNQLARLAQGRVDSSKFDYQFLRFESGRFGQDALAKLAQAPEVDIKSRATLMMGTTTPQFRLRGDIDPNQTEPGFSHAMVYPEGTPLPSDFKSQNWSNDANCLRNGMPCDIYVGPFGQGGAAAVIVNPTSGSQSAGTNYSNRNAMVYERDSSGRWQKTGTLNHIDCPDVAAAFRTGKATAVPPEHNDVMANGTRLRFIFDWAFEPQCQAEKPADKLQSPKTPGDSQAPAHMGPAFGSPR